MSIKNSIKKNTDKMKRGNTFLIIVLLHVYVFFLAAHIFTRAFHLPEKRLLDVR